MDEEDDETIVDPVTGLPIKKPGLGQLPVSIPSGLFG